MLSTLKNQCTGIGALVAIRIYLVFIFSQISSKSEVLASESTILKNVQWDKPQKILTSTHNATGNLGNIYFNSSELEFPVHIKQFEGESKVNLSSSAGHTNDISDFIRNGELSAIFCERCTESQRRKVEQILYLLYNFNSASSPQATENVATAANKNYVLYKKKRPQFKATSSPIPTYRKNLPEMIPTPETLAISSKFAQLPPTSTSTPATTSSGYSSMAIPIVPYFYTATSPLPSSSSTLSSALEAVQSVEMPTPPMPPTTTGPIYLYYMSSRSTSSSPASVLSSSGSLEQPTTPVAQSSVHYVK